MWHEKKRGGNYTREGKAKGRKGRGNKKNLQKRGT